MRARVTWNRCGRQRGDLQSRTRFEILYLCQAARKNFTGSLGQASVYGYIGSVVQLDQGLAPTLVMVFTLQKKGVPLGRFVMTMGDAEPVAKTPPQTAV